jgi:1,3-beta-glucan synthase
VVQGSINIARQMLGGALLFFIFRQQTSAYYFTQIVYYGGAKYIATGRGFDLTHTPYVKTFTSFGRSHLYFGIQLAMLAFMLFVLGIEKFGRSTWGTWLVAISLTISPFWFNPATFRLETVRSDFQAWRRWMGGSTDPGTKQSWCASCSIK